MCTDIDCFECNSIRRNENDSSQLRIKKVFG
ncbi:TPA: hypothetical protein IXJ14_002779 [Enterococcus faecium]|nr:hypothetical protein [Enterococcus faecium]